MDVLLHSFFVAQFFVTQFFGFLLHSFVLSHVAVSFSWESFLILVCIWVYTTACKLHNIKEEGGHSRMTPMGVILH